jgi:ketosteroid isomerase-like protein
MTQSPTTAAHNKQLLQAAWAELAKGNVQPIRELYADDIRWTTIGTTKWSKTYVGKQALRDELFGPLYALFADRYTGTAHRFIAEDDLVVVEARGQVTTKAGKPYHNTYCMIFRLAGGRIREVTEYCDTALIEAVL